MRRRVANRDNTQVPYFPPHGERIFPLFFQGIPPLTATPALGNRVDAKRLKARKVHEKKRKKNRNKSERDQLCGLYLQSISLSAWYSGAACCNQLTFLAFQENITSPLKVERGRRKNGVPHFWQSKGRGKKCSHTDLIKMTRIMSVNLMYESHSR